jgi:hypothetical protein
VSHQLKFRSSKPLQHRPQTSISDTRARPGPKNAPYADRFASSTQPCCNRHCYATESSWQWLRAIGAAPIDFCLIPVRPKNGIRPTLILLPPRPSRVANGKSWQSLRAFGAAPVDFCLIPVRPKNGICPTLILLPPGCNGIARPRKVPGWYKIFMNSKQWSRTIGSCSNRFAKILLIPVRPKNVAWIPYSSKKCCL